MREGSSDNAMDRAQGPMYGTEHSLAWLMAAVALVLGVLALLVGFDILGLRSDDAAAQEVASLPVNFLDGAMLMFSAITAAILAYTLHSTDHHRMRRPSTVNDADRSIGAAEHMGAYLMAATSIALVAIGLLVGYGAIETDNSQLDGLLWIWGGFGTGILAATLHTVRHHQMAETDEIVAIVTERVRTTGGTTTTTAQPQTRTTR